jgi:2-oxo-4-hydroxy-4-carboxy-5-ureidoimidazoline decarboxylase
MDQDQTWAAQEQARVADAAPDLVERLAARNGEYEARFGYIFIVCATGKSAGEMLGMLESRIRNDPGTELRIAANEQRKITRLRLAKLLDGMQEPL